MSMSHDTLMGPASSHLGRGWKCSVLESGRQLPMQRKMGKQLHLQWEVASIVWKHTDAVWIPRAREPPHLQHGVTSVTEEVKEEETGGEKKHQQDPGWGNETPGWKRIQSSAELPRSMNGKVACPDSKLAAHRKEGQSTAELKCPILFPASPS